MAPNPVRRDQLTDAGIRILARQGARGLTHRAVDAEAGVPQGTASNYFRSRDALLADLGRRILHRVAPPEEDLDPDSVPALTREDNAALMRGIVRRVLAERDLYIALLELRLEATRRPALREHLTEAIRRNVDADVAFHRAAGLPGGREEVVMLHLTIDGLLLDQLTLPDAVGIDDLDGTVGRIVDRLVPPASLV